MCGTENNNLFIASVSSMPLSTVIKRNIMKAPQDVQFIGKGKLNHIM